MTGTHLAAIAVLHQDPSPAASAAAPGRPSRRANEQS